jgi:nucleotide-binding universal stress UspA family protein
MSVQIVVGDDFEETGRLAIREALRRGRNAHLHVCHVISGGDSKENDAAISATSRKLWDRIGDVGIEVLGLTAANLSVHVRIGKPAEELEQLAADYDADVLIVGTKDDKGLKRLGSVATALIHNATCSVLVARLKSHQDVKKSSRPEAPKPGADLHEERHDLGYIGTQRVSWNTARPDGGGGFRMF